jgi:hypothetical protein
LGIQKVYPKGDGKVYSLNSSGQEFDLTLSGGSSYQEIMRLKTINII